MSQHIQIKTALIIFLKSASPVIMYFDEPEKIYENLKNIIQNPPENIKMIELDANGPIKKVNLILNEISGIALQEEQYVVQ